MTGDPFEHGTTRAARADGKWFGGTGQNGTGRSRGRGRYRNLDRRQFGNLRSSMFTVQAEAGAGGGAKPAAFVFTGGGWGHGVGMCQTGSTGMGAAGKSHQQILEHYYPGSQLKNLY